MKDLEDKPPYVPNKHEIARLATLPEHEWRLEITRLLLTLKHQAGESMDIAADTQEMTQKDLAEIKRILNIVKGGLAALDVLGKIAKWLTIMALFFTAVIGAIKAGESVPQLVTELTEIFLRGFHE